MCFPSKNNGNLENPTWPHIELFSTGDRILQPVLPLAGSLPWLCTSIFPPVFARCCGLLSIVTRFTGHSMRLSIYRKEGQ